MKSLISVWNTTMGWYRLIKYPILQQKNDPNNVLGVKSNFKIINPLSANPTKWSNISKQFVGISTQTIRRQKPTNCLSVFEHFAGLALKGLRRNLSENWVSSANKIALTIPRFIDLDQVFRYWFRSNPFRPVHFRKLY